MDWAAQTPYSDPRAHCALVDAVATDLVALSQVGRNVIVHYRGSGPALPESTREDINLRWLDRILDADQDRHRAPLATPREPMGRVQGCCRDHSLFCVGVLRQHGVAARTRVGFARYFAADFRHDHVVVEVREGERWRRFDPEVETGRDAIRTPTDLPTGPDTPFQTAAEAYRLMRAGEIDPDTYGATPAGPLRGDWFIHNYVLVELAHRYGDEVLLWDVWGAVRWPGDAADAGQIALLDGVTALLVAADAGDLAAETELEQRYRHDPRLRPGDTITQLSPYREPPREVSLLRG